jgi:hypothetical protein
MAEGLSARFRVADAESLPFEDASLGSTNQFHQGESQARWSISYVIPAPMMRCAATRVNASPARLREEDVEISRLRNNPRPAAVYSGNET